MKRVYPHFLIVQQSAVLVIKKSLQPVNTSDIGCNEMELSALISTLSTYNFINSTLSNAYKVGMES